jgi:hypothetical protein
VTDSNGVPLPAAWAMHGQTAVPGKTDRMAAARLARFLGKCIDPPIEETADYSSDRFVKLEFADNAAS